MNIIHLSPGLHPAGACQLAADLASALQAEDCNNIIFSPANELVSRISMAGVTHITCRKPNLLTLAREVTRLRKHIQKDTPNVLLAYSPAAAWVAGIACRREPASTRPKIVGILTHYPRKSLSNHGWTHCAAYTAISKFLRSVWEKKSPRFRQNHPWVIPYGINKNLCNPGYRPTESWMDQWKRTVPEAEKRLTLCIPAPITPIHGLEDVVELLSTLLRSGISAHICLAGDTQKANPAYLEILRKKYDSAQLSSHITWLGARADLRDVLCACDITLSLDKEPAVYNRPILEALALGRPVAAYDHGVAGELLETFMPEGRVKPGDIAAMADTISQWHTYRPAPLAELPYPYRLEDTAQNYRDLFQELGKQT